MKKQMQLFGISVFLILIVAACDGGNVQHNSNSMNAHGAAVEEAVEKGPHRGRILREGDFALELAIFETGVPPEFRAWATIGGKSITPQDVSLKVNLTRLGNKIDNINFAPQGDALRGDSVIYEPHSFIVEIVATHQGKTYTWKYDNFEGRTRIEDTVAEALGIKTEIAGPVTIDQTITAYGQISPNPENIRQVSARFDGEIKSVVPSIGDKVSKGQKLATIESNESLKVYSIEAPISGIIVEKNANPGEQTQGQILFKIINTATVLADVAIFPKDLSKVNVGALATVTTLDGETRINGKVTQITFNAESNQSVKARIKLDNKDGLLIPGGFVTADVKTGEYKAQLAVKRAGLQPFRDFTVVYAKVGDEYEVRMLELGLQASEWAEVLSGLPAGTRYVSDNSYVIKADIEKSGASHDH